MRRRPAQRRAGRSQTRVAIGSGWMTGPSVPDHHLKSLPRTEPSATWFGKLLMYYF
jgi:hypothetical protein